MQVVAPHVRDLVLVGGGHSNIQVLKYFGMRFHPGIRLTLISSYINSPYSGMISGLVSGNTNQITLISILNDCVSSQELDSFVEKLQGSS